MSCRLIILLPSTASVLAALNRFIVVTIQSWHVCVFFIILILNHLQSLTGGSGTASTFPVEKTFGLNETREFSGNNATA